MAEAPQHNPSVTPWTGNPVITGYIVSALVWAVVILARRYGHEVDPDEQNVLIQILTEPIAEVVAFVITGLIALYTRLRAYSELSVKTLTGKERPAVPKV